MIVPQWEAHHSPRFRPEGCGELHRSLIRQQWPQYWYQFLYTCPNFTSSLTIPPLKLGMDEYYSPLFLYGAIIYPYPNSIVSSAYLCKKSTSLEQLCLYQYKLCNGNGIVSWYFIADNNDDIQYFIYIYTYIIWSLAASWHPSSPNLLHRKSFMSFVCHLSKHYNHKITNCTRHW